MSLLTRLVAPAPGEIKLPVHQFMAAIAELQRGAPDLTIADVVVAFDLSPSEQVELNSVVANLYVNGISRDLIHDTLMLGEESIYSLPEVQARLVSAPVPTDVWALVIRRSFEIVLRGNNDFVIHGCSISPQAPTDMTLVIASGSVATNDTTREVSAGNVTITPADEVLPRIDVIVAASNGSKIVRKGVPAVRPIPANLSGNDVALCFVFVRPNATQIGSAHILDARVIRTTGPLVVAKISSEIVRNNSSAVETFISFPVPAGLLVAGRSLRVKCGGTMLLNSGTPNVALRLVFGGTTLFQDVTGNAVADTDRLAWDLEFVLASRGDTDQAMVGRYSSSIVVARVAPTSGTGDIAGTAALVNAIAGTSAVNTLTTTHNLLVQFQLSVANPSNEIVMAYATGELI